jgi:hypothetical protein
MSNKSSISQYFLRYRELGWLERPLPERPNFFSEATVRKICRITGAGPTVDQALLAEDLIEIADCYWIAAMSSPLGVFGGPESQSSDERRRKINTGVINPAEKLLASLSEENLTTLSEWPDTFSDPEPDRQILLEQLSRLVRRMHDLTEVLEDKKRKGSSFLKEFKIDLANALSEVFERHFPDTHAGRGGSDRTLIPSSPFHSFLNLCAKEIFGESFSLSGDVLDEVAKLRGNR